MSRLAIKLTDFNLDDGVSLTAITKPLSFAPVKADEACDFCLSAEEKLTALETKYEQDLATQTEDIQSVFEGQLQTLRQDLESQLKIGLSQCLTALFPALAETSLRRGLEIELQKSLMDSLPGTLSVRISPDLSRLIDAPSGVSLTDDRDLKGHIVEIRKGAARTRLDPDAILNRCLALLKPDTSSEKSA